MRQIHKTCLRSHGMAWTCRISSCIQYHPITSMCCSLFAVKHMPIAIMQWYQHILVHVTLKILVTCFIPCEHSLSNHVGHSMPTFFIVQADGVWATSSAHFHALKLGFKSCVAIAKTQITHEHICFESQILAFVSNWIMKLTSIPIWIPNLCAGFIEF